MNCDCNLMYFCESKPILGRNDVVRVKFSASTRHHCSTDHAEIPVVGHTSRVRGVEFAVEKPRTHLLTDVLNISYTTNCCGCHGCATQSLVILGATRRVEKFFFCGFMGWVIDVGMWRT